MKRYNKLFIYTILFFACLGIVYVTSTSFAASNPKAGHRQIPGQVLALSATNSLVDSKTEIAVSVFEHFSDSQQLKKLDQQGALAMLVKKGGLSPLKDHSLQPQKPVSLVEFIYLSLHWLIQEKASLTIQDPIQRNKAWSVTGSALSVSDLSLLGFKAEIPILVDGFSAGIPLFSENPPDYQKPISYGQAAYILGKISENYLDDQVPADFELDYYISNAYALKAHPYYPEICRAFALGLYSAGSTYGPWDPEQNMTRSQVADALYRLFQPENREKPITSHPLFSHRFSSNYYSDAIYLVDNTKKSVVFAKNPNKKRPPASLTKIMTVYLALDLIPDLEAKVRVSPDFRRKMRSMGASIAGFYANESVSYKDLVYATLLASGAEAAGTLAIQLAGSEAAFIEKMNQKALDLGMTNTYFKTVEGLDVEGQYTTAKDMAILLENALKNPSFYQVFTSGNFITSRNRLHPRGLYLRSTVLRTLSPTDEKGFHILGGKSGTTSGAGLCWATLANKNGSTYILITLGAPLDNIYKPTLYQKMDALNLYQEIP